jgi:dTMP kinase
VGGNKNFRGLLDGDSLFSKPFLVSLIPKTPGFLIAFEGIDGAGKTTQAHLLQDELQQKGLAVIRTKEPTTGQFGQILRDSALTGRLSLEEELECFIKDRQEHVTTKIQPAIDSGKIVIIDRYYFSTAAYQGCRGLDPAKLIAQNELFAPEPDLLILLDLEPKIGLDRIRTRGDRANHFEKTDTLAKAREIFLAIAKSYKVTVDATKSSDDVRAEILNAFWKRYNAKQRTLSATNALALPTKRS